MTSEQNKNLFFAKPVPGVQIVGLALALHYLNTWNRLFFAVLDTDQKEPPKFGTV